jgi:two-component system, OmpR family, response regulator ResD
MLGCRRGFPLAGGSWGVTGERQQPATILVVDDEPMVVEVVERYLRREGFNVLAATTGDEALAAATRTGKSPDLVILDVMLPGLRGDDVCRRLREEHGALMPIILLTARGEERDRIKGLGVGADDYVVKPFSPGELVARVKAQLRRVQMDTTQPARPGVLQGGDVVLEAADRTCTVRGKPVALTPKEFDLLHELMEHAGAALSRDELLDRIWDEQFFGYPGTVTVHIRRLREKIERDPDLPSHIKTVWGVGYKFDPSVG